MPTKTKPTTSDDTNVTPHEQWRADSIANAVSNGAPTITPVTSSVITVTPTTTSQPVDKA